MIYLVRRTDRPDYDKYEEAVVRASSEAEALSLVMRGNQVILDRPLSGFRADGSNAEVIPIQVDGGPEIICASFLAG